MHGKLLFAVEEATAPKAGVYVTKPDHEHIELLLKIAGVGYAVKLSLEQAMQLGAALVREHARDRGLRLVGGFPPAHEPGRPAA